MRYSTTGPTSQQRRSVHLVVYGSWLYLLYAESKLAKSDEHETYGDPIWVRLLLWYPLFSSSNLIEQCRKLGDLNRPVQVACLQDDPAHSDDDRVATHSGLMLRLAYGMQTRAHYSLQEKFDRSGAYVERRFCTHFPGNEFAYQQEVPDVLFEHRKLHLLTEIGEKVDS